MTANEKCSKCGAYLPADKIIERIKITEDGDKIAKVKHEKKMELYEPLSRSDEEKEKDKPCMLVEIRKFGSLVSIVINEEYVRASVAHEVAGGSSKYGPVEKTELWKNPRKTT